MSIKQAVTTVFKSRDEQSKNFNKMGKSAKRFGETSSRAFKKASKSASTFSSVTKGILTAGAVQKALSGVSQGLATVTTQFVQFDDAITASSAKFKGLDLTTKEGIKTLADLKKTARDVGATTKFNAVEAAQGLDFYATAGFNAAQAMAVLKPTAKLATIANLDLARTSDIASDSLGAFGLMTKDSAQLQKNFTRLSDVMAKTLTSTNVNMEDMFEAVKKGAPTFTATGQKVETFNALMGIMANSGVKGAEAGTQLRNMMLRLAKPTDEAQDALDTLGIRTRDNKGNFLDIVDVLGQFEKGLVGMGSAQKAAALKTIFGVRSITGLNLLLQEGSGNIRKFRTQLETAGGTTEDMASIMDKSLGNRLKSLGSAATELGFKFLEAFQEQGGNAIDTMTRFIRGINIKPLTDGIKTLFNFGKKLFDKFVEIGNRTGLFDNIKSSVESIQPIFDTLKDVITTVWGFLERTGVFDLLAKSFGILFKAVKPIAKAFEIMWKTVKPILNAFGIILTPIVKTLSVTLDAIGVTLDTLDARLQKSLDKTDQFKKEKISFSEFRQQERADIIKFPKRKSAIQLEREARLGLNATSTASAPTIKFFGQAEKDIESFAKRGLVPLLISKIAPDFARGRGEAIRELEPPNRIQPKNQDFRFNGQLNINGAPEGSTFEQEPGPTPVNVNLLAG